MRGGAGRGASAGRRTGCRGRGHRRRAGCRSAWAGHAHGRRSTHGARRLLPAAPVALAAARKQRVLVHGGGGGVGVRAAAAARRRRILVGRGGAQRAAAVRRQRRRRHAERLRLLLLLVLLVGGRAGGGWLGGRGRRAEPPHLLLLRGAGWRQRLRADREVQAVGCHGWGCRAGGGSRGRAEACARMHAERLRRGRRLGMLLLLLHGGAARRRRRGRPHRRLWRQHGRTAQLKHGRSGGAGGRWPRGAWPLQQAGERAGAGAQALVRGQRPRRRRRAAGRCCCRMRGGGARRVRRHARQPAGIGAQCRGGGRRAWPRGHMRRGGGAKVPGGRIRCCWRGCCGWWEWDGRRSRVEECEQARGRSRRAGALGSRRAQPSTAQAPGPAPRCAGRPGPRSGPPSIEQWRGWGGGRPPARHRNSRAVGRPRRPRPGCPNPHRRPAPADRTFARLRRGRAVRGLGATTSGWSSPFARGDRGSGQAARGAERPGRRTAVPRGRARRRTSPGRLLPRRRSATGGPRERATGAQIGGMRARAPASRMGADGGRVGASLSPPLPNAAARIGCRSLGPTTARPGGFVRRSNVQAEQHNIQQQPLCLRRAPTPCGAAPGALPAGALHPPAGTVLSESPT